MREVGPGLARSRWCSRTKIQDHHTSEIERWLLAYCYHYAQHNLLASAVLSIAFILTYTIHGIVQSHSGYASLIQKPLLYIISGGTCAQIGKRQIPGVRMSQVFKLLAQQATELGAYKLARTVHAKLNTLKVMKSPPPIVAFVVVLLAFVPPLG